MFCGLRFHPYGRALTVMLMALMMLASRAAIAGEKRKDAPSTEDMANYFSESRQGVSLENLKKAETLRLQTISSIGKLLKGKMRPSRKFELLLRLGELHAERHDYLRDMEMRAYDIAYQRWEKSGKKGREPKLSSSRSKAALVQSVNAFRSLVRQYPKHPRSDAALFSLAKTLLRLENDNAVLYFNQILRLHKNSPLLPDVYLALGEYHFYKHNMPQAIQNYRMAMKYKDSPVYPYAIYKLGWAFFNSTPKDQNEARKNIDKSIAAFKLVVALASKDSESRNLNLRGEAIKDLVVVFAENARTNEAFNYFANIGEKAAFYDMLERLGNTYAENGENLKAIDVYNRILSQSPYRTRNPSIHLKVAELYDAASQISKSVMTLESMNKRYVIDKSWANTNKDDPDAVREAAELVQKSIHRFSAAYHKLGYEAKNDNYLIAASRLYRTYLQTFPKAEESYELRYYLADIYFSFKKFDEAAREYYNVSRMKDDGKYKKDAAMNAVVSVKQMDEKQNYRKLPPLGQVPEPIKLPATKAKLMSVLDNYVRLLPNDKDHLPMRFTAAQTLFEYGHYTPAVKRFDYLATQYPQSVQGKTALDMVLGYHSERKQWPILVAKSRRYLGNERIIQAGHKDSVLSMLEHGTFQLALDQNRKGNLEESADLFVSFQKEFPGSESADDALYNATVSYYKFGEVDKAIANGKLLLKAYPKSSFAKDVTLDIAQANESLARFDEAAAYYRSYGINYRSDRKARLALFNSATLYNGIKNKAESVKLFETFIKLYPKDKLVSEAYLQIAEIEEERKNFSKSARYYQLHAKAETLATDEGLLAAAKAATLNKMMGRRKQAEKELARLERQLLSKNAPIAYEARRLVARERFNTLDRKVAEFSGMKLTDARQLEKQVAKKQGLLLEVVKGYEKIIELGSGEYTVASLYRLGEMHENFSQELFNAPSPAGASQLEIDQYRTAIEQVAFPLKDEALKYFEVAYNKSREVQTFSEWTKLARRRMVLIDSEKYPAISEKVARPEYLSHGLFWDANIANVIQ